MRVGMQTGYANREFETNFERDVAPRWSLVAYR
ncbi:hypothetical protein F01_50185 [Burkholderia cenocepacia]|nr:hypothetical protein F01_50185 [Burkholderia cenocepacia]